MNTLKRIWEWIKSFFARAKTSVMNASSSIRDSVFTAPKIIKKVHRLHRHHFGTFRPVKPLAHTRQRQIWNYQLVNRRP
jgi:hypothetical protein